MKGKEHYQSELFLGHDLGTGGAKSVVISGSGELIASSFEPYPTVFAGNNMAEQEPEEWWRAVCLNTRRMFETECLDSERIRGIGFSGQMITILMVDWEGCPLGRAVTWLDSRAQAQADRLIRRLGGKRVLIAITGALPSGKDIVCKIQWIRENMPEEYSKIHKFLDATGYLVFRATGRLVMDDTAASGTGVFDTVKRRWSRMLVRATSLPLEKMPDVARCTEVVGGLSDEAGRDMGLAPGIPVIAGMSDIPAAATGSGALGHGQAHVYLGTSSWACLCASERFSIGKKGIVAIASPDPQMQMILGESETAGLCLEWFSGLLSSARNPEAFNDGAAVRSGSGMDFEMLDRMAESVDPGSGNILFFPWLFGERSPVTDMAVRAGFVNLSYGHTFNHMLRAVYEGVGYNLRWMLDAFAEKGFPCHSVRAIGGGAKSDVWLQIISDVTGRRIEAVEHPQYAGAIGSALAAGVGTGIFSKYGDLGKVVRVRESYSPSREKFGLYDSLYAEYRALYPALSKMGRALNGP